MRDKVLNIFCEQVANSENNENKWNGVVVSSQSLIRLLLEYLLMLENSQLISTN